MRWDAISWTMDFEVSGQALQRTIRDALTYSTHLSALKEHLQEPLRQKREKWAGICTPNTLSRRTRKVYALATKYTPVIAPKGTFGSRAKGGQLYDIAGITSNTRDLPLERSAPVYKYRRQLGGTLSRNLYSMRYLRIATER